ncbi:fumarylacetoacetate hydrolase family protein [Cryptosporangium sp. NPDC051539]|uniref:fumarylacetoacetate hydrolase family protein n=1 Tax=Cryptosporangium sp. NPDC051539 TaxID=3363962 RepID=UPI0037A4EF13
MRLATVSTENGPVAAAVVGDQIVDLTRAAPALPRTLAGILALGDVGLSAVKAAIESGAGRGPLLRESLLSPIPAPPKIWAIGLNYAEHVRETGKQFPEFPTVFAKMPTTIAGPYADVQRPAVSEQLDYECELGIVIGKRCRHVSPENAHKVIAGFTVVNDFSVRDYQMRGGQWVLGKSFDGHGVAGPWIVTPDEVDPHALAIRTIVNGETRQESNTANLIFDCYRLIAWLSSAATLEVGDIIATGTPGGVGVMENRFLVPGDVVRVEIDGIGHVENRIVQEPDAVEWIDEPTAAVAF